MGDSVELTRPHVLTPDNCTVDGGKFRGYVAWDQLDWANAKFRTQATIMLVAVGSDAPFDPHWDVPHINGDTRHRIRLKGRRS